MPDYKDTAVGVVYQCVIDNLFKFELAESAFHNLPPEAQTERRESIMNAAELVVREIIRETENQGLRFVHGTLTGISIKKDCVASVKVSPEDENFMPLIMAKDMSVRILIPQMALDLMVADPQFQKEIPGITDPGWTPPTGDGNLAAPDDPESENIST